MDRAGGNTVMLEEAGQAETRMRKTSSATLKSLGVTGPIESPCIPYIPCFCGSRRLPNALYAVSNHPGLILGKLVCAQLFG